MKEISGKEAWDILRRGFLYIMGVIEAESPPLPFTAVSKVPDPRASVAPIAEKKGKPRGTSGNRIGPVRIGVIRYVKDHPYTTGMEIYKNWTGPPGVKANHIYAALWSGELNGDIAVDRINKPFRYVYIERGK